MLKTSIPKLSFGSYAKKIFSQNHDTLHSTAYFFFEKKQEGQAPTAGKN
jgi:hypothetical protein